MNLPVPPEVPLHAAHAGVQTQVRVAPLQRSPELTIVLLQDALFAADYPEIRKFITALHKSVRSGTPVRFGVLSKDKTLDLTAPLRSSAELQSVLRKALQDDNAGGEPPAESAVLDAAIISLAQIPSDWGRTLLIGHMKAQANPDEISRYASAWAVRNLIAQKRTLLFWDPSLPTTSPLLASISKATGGGAFNNVEEAAAILNDSGNLSGLDWDRAIPSRGFALSDFAIDGLSRDAKFALSVITTKADVLLPSIAGYADLRDRVHQAEVSISTPQTDLAAIRASLEQSLKVNPADAAALHLGIALAARQGDKPFGISLLELALELSPTDAALWTSLGNLQFEEKNFNAAEKAFLKARELGASNAASLEKLSRIRLAAGDLPQALGFVEESLHIDGSRAALWFFAADIARQQATISKLTDFLERGLAVGDDLARRTELIQVYLAAGDAQRAARQVDAELPRLPADADAQATWASFYERLARPDDALKRWALVLQADPKREQAHFAVASIHMNNGEWQAALDAADAGLVSAPSSSRLELAQLTSLDKLGRIYEARRSLDLYPRANFDIALLKRSAEMSDTFGGDGPGAYRRLVEAMQAPGSPSDEMTKVSARGLMVALREGDMNAAAWFREINKPKPALAPARPQAETPRDPGVLIPGGMEALAFISRGHTGNSPDRFLVDYCRTLSANLPARETPESAAYRKAIAAYFDGLRQLLALSTRTAGAATIKLGIATKPELSRTEAVLSILGWKLRRNKQEVLVESSEKAGEARKQELSSALAIDQGGMQNAFAHSKSFQIEIPMDRVPLVLGPDPWRTSIQFEKYTGGIAEALSQNPGYARAYLALSNVDKATAAVLVFQVGLPAVLTRYADLLSLYSASLGIANGHVATPGGAAAEPIWTKLCGASPANPPQFFRALFDKDDGKLLAWFFALSQLDLPHQRFFTLNFERTSSFYQAFVQSPDMRVGAGRMSRTGKFTDFLREIPLDGNTVAFPGSAEVWMVAKGRSASLDQSQRMLKKVRKAVAPDVEDSILLRLARTHYQSDNEHVSELDNFLAVTRIDEHRVDPLDPESALLLAQNYSDFAAVYPYFSVFPGLTAADYQSLFSFLMRTKSMDALEADTAVAQFYSLLEVVRLASDFGELTEARATQIVRKICAGFMAAPGAPEFADVSLDVVRELLGTPSATSDPDRLMENLVLGLRPPLELDWNGVALSFDAGKKRAISYRRILELQKAPSLSTLLRLDDTLRRLAAGREPYQPLIAQLNNDATRIPAAEIPKTVKFEGLAKQSLARTSPAKIAPLIAELGQKASKKKVNPADIQKIARELRTELVPQVRLALTGIVYAAYLRPDDVLVADDVLLLRKHQAIELGAESGHKNRFPQSVLQQESGGSKGSFFLGGFGQFAMAASRASNLTHDGPGSDVYRNQLASIRMTPFTRYSDNDQLFLGLSIRVAREWCVRAATDPAAMAALAEETEGILSLSRRRDLLDSIASGDWPRVWQSITLSDLIFLSRRYLERYPGNAWATPVEAAFRRLGALSDSSRLEILGSLPAELYGCNHPHLVRLAPYEEYERHLFPVELAERTAEMKIYLSNALDKYAVPAAAMPAISEAAAAKVFAAMKMSDDRDWLAAIQAFREIDGKFVGDLLEKQQ